MLEAALLLGVMVPQKWNSFRHATKRPHRWRNFYLIPGMAALLSRVVYGSYQWRRRTLMILLAGALGVPALIALFMLMVALLFWASDVSTILFVFLLPVVLGAIVFTAYWCVKKRRKMGHPGR